MIKINFIISVFLCIITSATSEDVLGCGGFVKSHVPIDFSKVEVKLLTKQGILKDKINCAPTNGYYFVPLYDKGEYVLELEPPPGWSFNPTRVELMVDGVTDLCSQGKDINFVFKGFGITGRVESLGADTGPENIQIELKSQSETRTTVTSTDGNFFFTPVYPGNYTVKISNTKWKLWKDSVQVVVTEGHTELPARSLIIQGYTVTGHVKTEDEPIEDVTVLLFASQQNNDVQVDGCHKEYLPGTDNKIKPVCHIKTDDNGMFTFKTVPFGKYYVMPYYYRKNIYFQPSKIEFGVTHGNVALKEDFQIVGFSMEGRVLESPSGAPLPKADIFFNGEIITQTKNDGTFKLEKLKAGTFTLKAEADGFLFNEITVKVNPNSKILPDLVPKAYRICGNIRSDKRHIIAFSEVLPQGMLGTDASSTPKIVKTASNALSGQFCEFLTPGEYKIYVIRSAADTERGLQFYPSIYKIDVTSSQADVVTFSQLKATVFGKVVCIQEKDCVGLQVILKPRGETTPDKRNIKVDVHDNSFKVDDVYPGLYDVTVSDNNKFCWDDSKKIIDVNSVTVEVPTIVQTGYRVVFISSHNTQITYKLPGEQTEKTLNVEKGRLPWCLEKNGSYAFNLNSCHTYASNIISFDTDSDTNEIFLNVQKHTVTLLIQSEQKHGDVTATVNIDNVKSLVGPLPYRKDGYELKLMMSPTDTAVIVPYSEILYFTPPIMSIDGRPDCENLGVKFKAVLGIVFKGKIIPALAGVLVTVEASNSDTLMAETDDKGVYRFPPLDKSKTYTVAAKKDSYVLVGPNADGDFFAHKLAEIVIGVLDRANNLPLQGTLLSLSGGESYRSNLQTDETGKIAFHSLSPGEYFLRPMMKEYSFEPSSKIVKVKEGQTVNVQLMGNRVAYSAYGQVTSLNGEPEEGIVVVAIGVANCSHFSEESTSESNGHFRIRGLQPYCSYDIKVKGSLNNKVHIERSAPRSIHLDKVWQDIHGLKMVIFRPLANLDLLVKVYAKNPESYKTLRIKVAREQSIVKNFDGTELKLTAATVYTGRVDTSSLALTHDNNYGVMVHIPPIPLDGASYSVHLESTQNNKLEPEPQYFVANSSFKYVELDLIVKKNVTEQDIKQTSIWTLVFIFGTMLAVYNVDKISALFRDHLGNYFGDAFNYFAKKPNNTEHVVDYDDIDQIVKSINAVKRKPKPKRI